MSVESIYTEQARILGESRRARGAIYGNLVQNLSRVPGQIMDARRAEQDRAAAQAAQGQQVTLRGQQIEQNTRELADDTSRRAGDSILARITPAVLGADGSFDTARAISMATESGHPEVIPRLQKYGAEWNASALEAKGKQAAAKKAVQEAQQWHDEQLGKDARDLLADQADEGTVLAWLTKRAADQFLPQDQAEQMAQQAQSPGGRVALLTGLARKAPADKVIERDPTKTYVNERTGAVEQPAAPKIKEVTFGQPTPAMVNGRRVLIRAGSDGSISTVQGVTPDVPPVNRDGEPLVAIMGLDDKPVLVPRSQAAGKRPANTREQGRPVTSGDAGRMADFDTSISDLGVLKTTLTETKGATGTGAAIGAGMPAWATDLFGWGTEPKKRQGVIDRVKQVIGKTLEGGVLRKEDEIKYEKILPTIKDTAEVAESKLAGLKTAIEQRRSTFLDALADAGYETSRYLARTPEVGKIRARDPQGVLHEAAAGTALPAGWKQEP